MANILLTGGTGLIGTHLITMLLAGGHSVVCLVRGGPRDHRLPAGVTRHDWQPDKGLIDPAALQDIDTIIHLAGAGIADARWSTRRKQELIDSRTQTIRLIAECLQKMPQHQVTTLISASAIGAYGADAGAVRLTEQSPRGHDFAAHIVSEWEQAVETAAASCNIPRTVMLRTGIVLSTRGGALPKFMRPVSLGVGLALGSGEQWQSWIHIDDLCRLYLSALEQNGWHGVYNAVAPHAVTNTKLVETLARQMHRPVWAPNVPAGLLKLIFGEMATLVLGSANIVPARLQSETDFAWRFDTLDAALSDLLQTRR